MKLKKENKALDMYNFWFYINSSNYRREYNIFSKRFRIQFKNINYYQCSPRWFPYKNLELNCASPHIAFAII